MMSPLAFLQEGEIAEIVDAAVNNQHDCRHRNQHGCKKCHCSIPCAVCSCRHPPTASYHAQPHSHLQEMGLRPGKKVEMITNNGSGPLVLLVDECRIAMGRGIAMKIYVRRNVS